MTHLQNVQPVTHYGILYMPRGQTISISYMLNYLPQEFTFPLGQTDRLVEINIRYILFRHADLTLWIVLCS